MMLRRSIHAAAAFATLVAPLAAFAQIAGTVTTGPAGQPAPALATPLIFLLAAALAGVAVYRLRQTAAGPIARLVVVAVVTMVAVFGYATVSTITISGADCAKQTINTFEPFGLPTTLMSECPNLIQILDIQIPCVFLPEVPNPNPPSPNPPCSIGETLANGGACILPICPAG